MWRQPCQSTRSASPLSTDIVSATRHVRKVPGRHTRPRLDGMISVGAIIGEYANLQSQRTGYPPSRRAELLMMKKSRVHHASRRRGAGGYAPGCCAEENGAHRFARQRFRAIQRHFRGQPQRGAFGRRPARGRDYVLDLRWAEGTTNAFRRSPANWSSAKPTSSWRPPSAPFGQRSAPRRRFRSS